MSTDGGDAQQVENAVAQPEEAYEEEMLDYDPHDEALLEEELAAYEAETAAQVQSTDIPQAEELPEAGTQVGAFRQPDSPDDCPAEKLEQPLSNGTPQRNEGNQPSVCDDPPVRELRRERSRELLSGNAHDVGRRERDSSYDGVRSSGAPDRHQDYDTERDRKDPSSRPSTAPDERAAAKDERYRSRDDRAPYRDDRGSYHEADRGREVDRSRPRDWERDRERDLDRDRRADVTVQDRNRDRVRDWERDRDRDRERPRDWARDGDRDRERSRDWDYDRSRAAAAAAAGDRDRYPTGAPRPAYDARAAPPAQSGPSGGAELSQEEPRARAPYGPPNMRREETMQPRPVTDSPHAARHPVPMDRDRGAEQQDPGREREREAARWRSSGPAQDIMPQRHQQLAGGERAGWEREREREYPSRERDRERDLDRDRDHDRDRDRERERRSWGPTQPDSTRRPHGEGPGPGHAAAPPPRRDDGPSRQYDRYGDSGARQYDRSAGRGRSEYDRPGGGSYDWTASGRDRPSDYPRGGGSGSGYGRDDRGRPDLPPAPPPPRGSRDGGRDWDSRGPRSGSAADDRYSSRPGPSLPSYRNGEPSGGNGAGDARDKDRGRGLERWGSAQDVTALYGGGSRDGRGGAAPQRAGSAELAADWRRAGGGGGGYAASPSSRGRSGAPDDVVRRADWERERDWERGRSPVEDVRRGGAYERAPAEEAGRQVARVPMDSIDGGGGGAAGGRDGSGGGSSAGTEPAAAPAPRARAPLFVGGLRPVGEGRPPRQAPQRRNSPESQPLSQQEQGQPHQTGEGDAAAAEVMDVEADGAAGDSPRGQTDANGAKARSRWSDRPDEVPGGSPERPEGGRDDGDAAALPDNMELGGDGEREGRSDQAGLASPGSPSTGGAGDRERQGRGRSPGGSAGEAGDGDGNRRERSRDGERQRGRSGSPRSRGESPSSLGAAGVDVGGSPERDSRSPKATRRRPSGGGEAEAEAGERGRSPAANGEHERGRSWSQEDGRAMAENGGRRQASPDGDGREQQRQREDARGDRRGEGGTGDGQVRRSGAPIDVKDPAWIPPPQNKSGGEGDEGRRREVHDDGRQPRPPPADARREAYGGGYGDRRQPPPPAAGGGRRDDYDDRDRRRPPPPQEPARGGARRDPYDSARPPVPMRRDEYDDRRPPPPGSRHRDDATDDWRSRQPPPPLSHRREEYDDRRPPPPRGGRDEYADRRPLSAPHEDRRQPPPPQPYDRRPSDGPRDREYGGRGYGGRDGGGADRAGWERDRDRDRDWDRRGRPGEAAGGYRREGDLPGRRGGSPPPPSKRPRLSPPPRGGDDRGGVYRGPPRQPPPHPQPPLQPPAGMSSADFVRSMMAAPPGPAAGHVHSHGPGPFGPMVPHRGPPEVGGAASAGGYAPGGGQGAAAGAAMTVEQKRKLLWTSKKVEAEVHSGVESLFGANRWDRAAEVLETDRDKERFQRLMGLKGDIVKPTGPYLPGAEPRPPSPEGEAHLAMTREQQDRVLQDIEQQYMAGLRRKDGRTAGLGI